MRIKVAHRPARVAILISGGGSNMQKLVQSMAGDHPGRACVVVSNVPGAKGLARARALGVPTACVDHRAFGRDRAAFEGALQAALAPHRPDLICLAGFMRVLTPRFVTAWAGRVLNIHPSLLPAYRGLDTHARALAAGDTQAGCTVHQVIAALDDGVILGQARVPILPGDSAQTLADRVLVQEHRLYPIVLRRVLGSEPLPVICG